MKVSLKDIALTAAIAVAAMAVVLPASAQLRGGASANEAIAFKDPGFRGQALVIEGAEPNLAEIRFNDTISSIELSGTWEICTDPNYRGRCEVIDGPVSHLSEFRLNDNITSLRPINGRRAIRNDRRQDNRRRERRVSGNGDAIVLFRDPEQRGAAVGFDRAIRDLKDARFNDTASSIRVNSGQWLVCEHPDYRGNCEVVDGTVWNLRNLGLNDRISSLRRYDGRGDYARRNDRYNQRRTRGYSTPQPRTVGYGNDRDRGYGRRD